MCKPPWLPNKWLKLKKNLITWSKPVLTSACADKTKTYQSSSDSCEKAWVSFISLHLSSLCKTVFFVIKVLINRVSFIFYTLFWHPSNSHQKGKKEGMINRWLNTKYIISLILKCYYRWEYTGALSNVG